jgi:hypothetical protein
MTSRSGEVNAMTLHARPRMLYVCIQAVVIAASTVSIPPLSASQVPRIPRVRDNGDPSIAALLQEATERSATFRHLVDSIDTTDGIVYVERGTCGHHVQACLALTTWVAGPSRILRIVVNTHRDHGELLASIGHELQHAVEALSDPHVRDVHSMYSFFNRIGPTSEGRFETEPAIQAGMRVFAEWEASTR